MSATTPTGSAETRPRRARVFMLGASGTIGRATLRALLARGHEVVCLVRPGKDLAVPPAADLNDWPPASAVFRHGDPSHRDSLAREGFRGERFDALVSCMASRTGVPRDAWAIDHQAHVDALELARQAGVQHMVLLSAICVQKPMLAFQHAKLAFEQRLMESGLTYSIVRPTAFFKSLSGQVERVRQGKPFLVFGDGTLTACKPISDRDLAHYLADCLEDPALQNRVLPIGGPGPAITPRQQGEHLFALFGQAPQFRQVPPALLSAIALLLGAAGRLIPGLAAKAELARIGHYYATESMLVLDPKTGRYDTEATPSTGADTLFDYYAQLVRGEARAERGEHAVF